MIFEYFTHIGSHHFRWRVGLISISIIYSLYAQCSTLWNYQAKGICRLQAGWLIVHDPFVFKSFIEDLIMTATEIFWYTVPTRYCKWEWLAIRWHMQGLLADVVGLTSNQPLANMSARWAKWHRANAICLTKANVGPTND